MKNKESELEKCVSCWEKTDIRKDAQIDLRGYYVEGAGQLCKDCYIRIYSDEKIAY